MKHIIAEQVGNDVNSDSTVIFLVYNTSLFHLQSGLHLSQLSIYLKNPFRMKFIMK